MSNPNKFRNGYSSSSFNVVFLATTGCLLHYLPVLMGLHLNLSNYDNLTATPLSNGLKSEIFFTCMAILIGTSVPVLLDFLVDIFQSSSNVNLHPAKSAIWLILLSSLLPNVFIFSYIIPSGRMEFWPSTISLESTIIVISYCFLLNAYGSSIFTWKWILTIDTLVSIAQIMNSFIPFLNPDFGTTISYLQLLFYLTAVAITFGIFIRWTIYLNSKYKANISLSTDDIYCTVNFILFVAGMLTLLIIGYATTGSSNLEIGVVGMTSRVIVFTAFSTMSMVLNMRHIRESLESAKKNKDEDSNNSSSNMDSMYVDASTVSLVEDLQGSCQSAVDILNDLLVYESLSGKDMGSMEMMTRLRTVCGHSFLINKINALTIQARQKGVSMEVINVDEMVDDHDTAGAMIDIDESQSEYNLRISVHDNGPEILEGDRNNIFQNHLVFTAGVLQTGEAKGLGLWISHRVMELHKGRLYLEPNKNENTGNTFIIEIPILEFANRRRSSEGTTINKSISDIVTTTDKNSNCCNVNSMKRMSCSPILLQKYNQIYIHSDEDDDTMSASMLLGRD
eukprot:gene13274-28105_t